MAAYDQSFQPGPTVTQNLAVTATAASITLNNLNNRNTARTVRVVNSGSTAIWVDFSATATTTQSMVLLPNTVESFTVPPGCTAISCISTGVAGTVYITTGDGKCN